MGDRFGGCEGLWEELDPWTMEQVGSLLSKVGSAIFKQRDGGCCYCRTAGRPLKVCETGRSFGCRLKEGELSEGCKSLDSIVGRWTVRAVGSVRSTEEDGERGEGRKFLRYPPHHPPTA